SCQFHGSFNIGWRSNAIGISIDPLDRLWNSGSPGKAGWLKKCSRKFLGVYKDRYVQLEQAEIAIYENEDLQKCVERLPLENYEKCHELKSTFKKKNRLVLIRSPRSGNKVHDVKLQAQTPEEKEAWIKAVSDAINGMKNNIFDESPAHNIVNVCCFGAINPHVVFNVCR
uniref:Pleckstrin homology domain containing O2 n=1 Tax=Paramormyrops kingsleyae TaxID=1676925 RepID=A0A3B3T9R6_9TELE